MRTMLLLFLVLPLSAVCQRNDMFIKLTASAGQPIKGEATTKGYERAIQAITLGAAGKNNTQLDFTMVVSGASADLKQAMATGRLLAVGEVYVIVPNLAAGNMLYTIRMEQITVLSCTEAAGCDGKMTTMVSLQATRIGWTYYTINRSGVSTVSRKYGWDNAAGAEWTNF